MYGPVFEFDFDKSKKQRNYNKKTNHDNHDNKPKGVLAPGLWGLIFAIVVLYSMIDRIDYTIFSIRTHFICVTVIGIWILDLYVFISKGRPRQFNEQNSNLGLKCTKPMKMIGFFLIFLGILGIISPWAGYELSMLLKKVFCVF